MASLSHEGLDLMELKSVVYLNTFHRNSDRATRGL